ncbi:MAG: response regulator, partial [Caldilinea sp.]|nr:response regulator [Caldilinea sp.]
MGQLAAGIAHDFNNILSVILLQAQMAKQIAGLTEQARDRMDVIVAQTQHATDLVRQILDFSRQSMLMRQAVDLRAICIEQVGLLERALPEIITIQFEHEAGADYVVNGDATSLRQIIMNLAINARDAMPDGGSLRIALATLRYDTTRETPLAGMAVGEWVRLTVADSGFGIAADILPHIFDPFFTTKDPGKGTGLGLAQVHGIVAQHEGHLAVETAPNAGTTFHIYLPAVVEAQDLASGRRPGGLPRGGGETILLVEDNQILRLALTDMLESLNYTVVDASNGREALARRTEHGDRIAVVLSDVVMPEMGGIALAHALRMNSFLQPIILMSGHPLDEDTETLQDAGVKTWLSKP